MLQTLQGNTGGEPGPFYQVNDVKQRQKVDVQAHDCRLYMLLSNVCLYVCHASVYLQIKVQVYICMGLVLTHMQFFVAS